MSGIAAVLETNGEPLEREQLQRMASCMSFRGPDGIGVWVEGCVGMSHAAFHTTYEAAHERQPLTLDGRVWLNAHARLDDRASLKNRLTKAGQDLQEPLTDAALILHAYLAWKSECTHFLSGDFSFIVWDTEDQRLFCARDQLGIRPLYYALEEGNLVVGNTLSCLRHFPGLPQNLDELAIVDYLLFGHYADLAMTAYQAIRRLPPGHTLTWEQGTLAVKRYWNLFGEPPLNYKRSEEVVLHFRELFAAAVGDRLRSDRVALALSGGLDSTSVAAAAARQLQTDSSRKELHGFTNGYRQLLADDEERYARRAAAHLGLTLHVRDVGQYALFERWDELDLRTSEPADRTLAAWSYDHERESASFARVVLTGLGGDPLFFPEPGYLYALLKPKRLPELGQALQMCWQERRFPPPYLRTRLRQRFGPKTEGPMTAVLPSWLNPDLAGQYDLDGRWRRFHRGYLQRHPRRPGLLSGLASPFWASLLESFDAEHSYAPQETRHPFFDLRLVRFMLRLPPVPWCLNKHLLRAAVRDYLPDEVWQRPKQPLASFPRHPIDAHDGLRAMHRLSGASALVGRFGDIGIALDALREPQRRSTAEYASTLRLIGLANWLDGNQK